MSVTPALAGRCRGILGTHWPAGLAEMVISASDNTMEGLGRWLCGKNEHCYFLRTRVQFLAPMSLAHSCL